MWRRCGVIPLGDLGADAVVGLGESSTRGT